MDRMITWTKRLILTSAFLALIATNVLTLTNTAFNAALWHAWEDCQSQPRPSRSAANLAVAAALIATAWGWGVYELAQRPTDVPSARVEILQPAIDQYEKWDATYARRVLDVFDELLSSARVQRPSLIIWPVAITTGRFTAYL